MFIPGGEYVWKILQQSNLLSYFHEIIDGCLSLSIVKKQKELEIALRKHNADQGCLENTSGLYVCQRQVKCK